MPQTLIAPLQANRSDDTAIILPKTATEAATISYKRLGDLVDKIRSNLDTWNGNGKRPLVAGDAVSLYLGNGIEVVSAFLAIGAHRCVAAPLNPSYNEAEVAFYLEDTKSKLLFVHEGVTKNEKHPAVLAARKLGVPLAEITFRNGDIHILFEGGFALLHGGGFVGGSGNPREWDVALVLHTSGTTGRPKAVPLTHLNLATTTKNITDTYLLSKADRSFLVMPLFHVHGLLAGLLAPLYSGGSVVIPPRFSAHTFWSDFIESQSNWYTAVPTIHQILLKSPKPSPIPNIRFIRSCSSALSPTTFHELEKTFQAPILEAYAMTEAAHQMTSNPLKGPQKPGSVGLGQGVKIRILAFDKDEDVEEGEVSISGANVTSGYLNNAKANIESFTKDGFFRTGDRGRLDKDGYLHLTGRIKELINRGGEKISPLELDAQLLATDGVSEAVAFGVPDPKYGEAVWAAVVPKSGATVSQDSVVTALKSKVAAFKLPARVLILDAIPKTATGKIQRRGLASELYAKYGESKPKL